jgi:hypothetical protein
MKTKIKHALTIIPCSFIMVSLFACGSNGVGTSSNTISQNPLVGESSSNTNTAISQNPLAGTWASGEYILTFKSDNTYFRDYNHEGMPTVRGSVRVSGNVIILTDSDSCISTTTGETLSGSYTYAISGNTLTLSLFHDPCKDRAAFLRLTYTKQ